MSQTVTKTNDSLTLIPTKHLYLMVRDLEEGDKCAKKLILVQDNLNLCEEKNKKLDSVITIFSVKENLYKENINSYESIIVVKDLQIQKLKKSRKMIAGGGLLITILSIFIIL